jgi:hypothetical protein
MEVVVRSRPLILTLALLLAGGFLALPAAAAPPAAAEDEAEEQLEGKTVQHYRPEACKKCHEEIYNQWKSSMHAKSTALEDPIHGTFYEQEVGSPKEEGAKHKKSGTYPVCLNCHAPVAAMEGKTKLDDKKAYANGVGCTTCHSFTAYKGIKKPDGKLQLGQAAYVIDHEFLHGPSGISYTKKRVPKDAKWPTPVNHPQPMKGSRSALFKSNDICMGCHDQRNNPADVPLCMTGSEYSEGKTFIHCQACHMPPTDVVNKEGKTVTVFDHTMAGGHDAKMVTQGVALQMTTTKEGDKYKAEISLRNRLPHAYPTGAPFRNAVLKVAAYDKDGKLLWQNYEKHPSKDDPKAFFAYIMGKDGQPAMPPDATEILKDTRLKPDETRVVEYTFPAEGVGIVRAEFYYNLLSPPLIEKFGDKLPDDVKKPKLAASAEERFGS